jgi:hypothetical protein
LKSGRQASAVFYKRIVIIQETIQQLGRKWFKFEVTILPDRVWLKMILLERALKRKRTTDGFLIFLLRLLFSRCIIVKMVLQGKGKENHPFTGRSAGKMHLQVVGDHFRLAKRVLERHNRRFSRGIRATLGNREKNMFPSVSTLFAEWQKGCEYRYPSVKFPRCLQMWLCKDESFRRKSY